MPGCGTTMPGRMPMSLESAAARREAWKESSSAAASSRGRGAPGPENAEQHTSNFMCGKSSDRTDHRTEFHRLDGPKITKTRS
eukprot:579130-Pelagomonas_calceolata.AAC.1